MSSAPKVFISAATSDLGNVRRAVSQALLNAQIFPVEQSHHGLSPGTLVERLQKLIRDSAAVVHIVGRDYGKEPENPLQEFGRCSYTQFEFYFSRKVKVPTYVIMCSEAFPYAKAEPEGPELNNLQLAYRETLCTQSHDFQLAHTLDEVLTLVTSMVADLVQTKARAAKRRPRVERGSAERLQCWLEGAETVQVGGTERLDVWVFHEGDREEVAKMAADPRRGNRRGARPAKFVSRVAPLQLQLSLPVLRVEPDNQKATWNHEPIYVPWSIEAPAGTQPRRYSGSLRIFSNGVQVWADAVDVQVVDPNAEVSSHERVVRALDESPVLPRSAYVSYAAADRPEVFARLQGISAFNPDIDFFVDVLSLRAGEDWQKRIEGEIAQRDVFYLFWSRNAARSEWVEREWRTALRLKGMNAIFPVPLEELRAAPPPMELAGLHFNDAYLALVNAR